jgi:uncharacterized protein (DUF1015 family)
MAEILPFRGTRYVTSEAGDFGNLISPPYDVINPAMRETLYDQSDHNVARIIKADRQDDDAPYAAAAKLWQEWRESGAVAADPEPAIYVYEQHFEIHEHKFSRTGIIALVKLQEPGKGIMPHEKTLAGHRADRLELLRATETQCGLVFSLYPDPERRIDALLEQAKAGPPIMRAADRNKQMHCVWAITDPEVIRQIQETMMDKDLLIADGHHRYETALAYRKENPDCKAADYRMMALVNTANVGLVVLPTHRMVKALPEFSGEELLAKLRKEFTIRTYPGSGDAVREAVLDAIHAAQAEGRHAFGLDMGDGNHYVLELINLESMADVADQSEAWRSLDVAILHHLILEKTLGITAEKIQSLTSVEYVQDFPHAMRAAAKRLDGKDGQALFLLNPTRIEDVVAVAENGERMPQKSTFFYPKVFTGLVFNCLDNSLEA